MNKTYKGWQLLKAIADGEIKERSRFYVTTYLQGKPMRHQEAYFSRNDIYWKSNNNQLPAYVIITADFELISESTEEIDIQGIEEINLEVIRTFKDDLIMFNTLIKAIKQLDNQIKEKE